MVQPTRDTVESEKGWFSFNSPKRREEDDREHLSALVCVGCVVADIPSIDKRMSALLTRA